MTRFFDMFLFVLMKTEMGLGGFLLAILIHLQLYGLVFIMMWCASHVKEIADRMKMLQAENAGTYKGLELRGVEDALQTREPNDPGMIFPGARGTITLDEDMESSR